MTDVRVTLTDNSDRPNSQKEEHVAMNALFQSMTKGSQPPELHAQNAPKLPDNDNEGMNLALRAMAGSEGYLR